MERPNLLFLIDSGSIGMLLYQRERPLTEVPLEKHGTLHEGLEAGLCNTASTTTHGTPEAAISAA